MRKNSFLLLLGGIVLVSASIVYVLITSNVLSQPASRAMPTASVHDTSNAELSQARPQKPCSLKQRDFQMGVSFPQWTPAGYGDSDSKWQTELSVMRAQTAACWIGMPILFSQSSLTSTTVIPGASTPSIASFSEGVHLAHTLGLHVFVTPLIQVSGPQSWSGSIHFATYEQEQQWFASYWQTIKPYVVNAEQDGVEQFALGTEYEWLQENAPDTLWNGLVSQMHSVFSGALTYDINWTSLQKEPRAWMRNTNLKTIGVSTYLPMIDTPRHVDPAQVFDLWKQKVKQPLDAFALALGKPIFISEIGYRNSADALYHSWESSSSAPPDQAEQAAACDAALANILNDKAILGSFFWGWDDAGAFNLKGLQAVTVIHKYYQSLQA
jgi:hypothetical protein